VNANKPLSPIEWWITPTVLGLRYICGVGFYATTGRGAYGVGVRGGVFGVRGVWWVPVWVHYYYYGVSFMFGCRFVALRKPKHRVWCLGCLGAFFFFFV
jgi:hypothetical protein